MPIAAIYHMTFFQAIVIGVIQGITELFPISSLGHTVLIPAWIGGTWRLLVSQESQAESPYLAFVVGLHLSTAVVLLGFYVREWVRLVRGGLRSAWRRRVVAPEERLAWLIVVATIPVGILGIVFEHQFRVLFAKPAAAAAFLTANGVILFVGERRRRHVPEPSGDAVKDPAGSSSDRERRATIGPEDEIELSRIGLASSAVIGASQALALLAGISREGVAMVGGLLRGLNHENALRFAFLLSTPVILAAGLLKVPDLLGTLGNGIRMQVVAGSIAAVVTSLLAVLFLARWFRTRTLVPFAVYSLVFGLASVIRFGLF
jgi:undecaprenyl-diphosphatase